MLEQVQRAIWSEEREEIKMNRGTETAHRFNPAPKMCAAIKHDGFIKIKSLIGLRVK